VNKTAMFICFSALAAIGIIGAVVLAIHRPDASATFTALIVTVLGLASTAGGTFYALNKQGEKIDTIQGQTNGTLSKLREDNQGLHEENAELREKLGRTTGRHRTTPRRLARMLDATHLHVPDLTSGDVEKKDKK